jgi:proteasome lid subunit RPN8/RPN11
MKEETEEIGDVTRTRTQNLTLVLEPEQLKTIKAMYDVSEKESCEMLALGECEIDAETGTVWIQKFTIPKQVSNPAHCEADDEEIAKMIMREQKINVWIHTHPSMDAFWSAEDDDTARVMSEKCDYLLSVVIGDGHKIAVRLDMSFPFKLTLDMDYEVGVDEDDEVFQKMERTFKRKVKKEVPPTIKASVPGGKSAKSTFYNPAANDAFPDFSKNFDNRVDNLKDLEGKKS